MTAYDMARNDRSLVQMVSRELAITPDGIFDRIGALSVRIRELEKENRRLRTHGTAGGDDLLSGAVDLDGIKVVFGRIDVSDTGELKGVADMIRGKIISGVAVVGATVNGKVTIIATVTDDIIKSKSLKAGDIVRELAVLVGGSGGGRPHFAMAGGKDADKLDAALASVPSIIMKLAGIKD
jgi:alanyl-tRNA synthetase